MKFIKSKRNRAIPCKYYRDRKFFFKNSNRNSANFTNISSSTSSLSDCQTNASYVVCESSHNETIDIPIEEIEREVSADVIDRTHLRFELRQWALKYGVNHNAISALLMLLRSKLNQCLPKTSRGLLKTPRNIFIQNIDGGGQLWYNGIRSCLQNSVFAEWPSNETIGLNFNMDGLPLFKSSALEFWPILMNVADMPQLRPMVVAIYYGRGKPKSCEQYLRQFVNELNDVQLNGIHTSKGAIVKGAINAIICDAPARSYVKSKD